VLGSFSGAIFAAKVGSTALIVGGIATIAAASG